MPQKQKPEDEKQSVTLSGRFTPSEAAEIKRIAAADRRTTSFIVVDAVREYLERHGKRRKS